MLACVAKLHKSVSVKQWRYNYQTLICPQLCCQPSTNRTTKLVWIYRCRSKYPTNEWHMIMISGASLAQFLCNVTTVGEESCRFQNLPQCTADSPGSACRSKVTHVRSHSLDIVELRDLCNFRREPTGCQPWVFMYEIESSSR